LAAHLVHHRDGGIGSRFGGGYHAKIIEKGEVTMKVFVFKMPAVIGSVLRAIFGIKKLED
jgi:hypothetical protein